MKTSSLLLILSAALAGAQVTFLPNGTYSCAIPGGNYCAGDSLVTNIIIRCVNGVGGAGNCDDNLDGEPPFGLNYAPCYQSSPTAGDAACSKDGIVYGLNGTFPVPGTVNTTSSVASASASPSTPANVSTAPYATGTAPGSGGVPNPSILPVPYTGAAYSVIALGHKSQILRSAVALLGLAAGMGWFL
ncbi:hypothetical protein MMC08_005254 [Hypocenomyce scalaris]|nr:hypothetical protein [Hypocenomyce scalaris]